MSSYNNITIVGNLGKDPEQRAVGDDNSVTSFTVATSRKFKTRNGDLKEETQWHRVSVWGTRGENCARYLSKGSKVLVSGEMRYRKYTTEDGQERMSADISANEVQFLSPKNEEKTGSSESDELVF